jgi:hypothetical protein
MSLRSWLELLADSGWAAPAWPAAWYGKGLPADLAAVAIAEFGAAGGLPKEPDVSRDVPFRDLKKGMQGQEARSL